MLVICVIGALDEDAATTPQSSKLHPMSVESVDAFSPPLRPLLVLPFPPPAPPRLANSQILGATTSLARIGTGAAMGRLLHCLRPPRLWRALEGLSDIAVVDGTILLGRPPCGVENTSAALPAPSTFKTSGRVAMLCSGQQTKHGSTTTLSNSGVPRKMVGSASSRKHAPSQSHTSNHFIIFTNSSASLFKHNALHGPIIAVPPNMYFEVETTPVDGRGRTPQSG